MSTCIIQYIKERNVNVKKTIINEKQKRMKNKIFFRAVYGIRHNVDDACMQQRR